MDHAVGRRPWTHLSSGPLAGGPWVKPYDDIWRTRNVFECGGWQAEWSMLCEDALVADKGLLGSM